MIATQFTLLKIFNLVRVDRWMHFSLQITSLRCTRSYQSKKLIPVHSFHLLLIFINSRFDLQPTNFKGSVQW